MNTNSSTSSKPVVAAFDFDGTITTRDTLLPFLIFAAGRRKTLKHLVLMIPTFLGFLLNMVSRQRVKEKLLTRFFAGMPLSLMQELGNAFSRSQNLNKLVRPEALETIAWHLQQGHKCILVSATIDIYLEPWAKRLGFSNVISSRLETTTTKLVTGRLDGLNCRGAEKARRLQDLLGPRNQYILYAYGDSRGDKELLALADHPFFRKW